MHSILNCSFPKAKQVVALVSLPARVQPQEGRGGHFFRGKRGGQGGGRSSSNYQYHNGGGDKGENSYRKPQYYCKKYGHIERYCRLKEKQANFAEEKEKDKTESLFLACYSSKECVPDVWYMDSGCSNHMTA